MEVGGPVVAEEGPEEVPDLLVGERQEFHDPFGLGRRVGQCPRLYVADHPGRDQDPGPRALGHPGPEPGEQRVPVLVLDDLVEGVE